VSSAPIQLPRFNETVLTILRRGIHSVSSAPAISSRLNETVLTIRCLPSLFLRPGLMRWCSLSCVLRAYQVRLTSVSSGCASRSRILQMHPRQVRIAPTSSKCASPSVLLQVCFSLPSPRLLRVHFTPPSASPASKFTFVSGVLTLSSMCASCRWW